MISDHRRNGLFFIPVRIRTCDPAVKGYLPEARLAAKETREKAVNLRDPRMYIREATYLRAVWFECSLMFHDLRTKEAVRCHFVRMTDNLNAPDARLFVQHMGCTLFIFRFAATPFCCVPKRDNYRKLCLRNGGGLFRPGRKTLISSRKEGGRTLRWPAPHRTPGWYRLRRRRSP